MLPELSFSKLNLPLDTDFTQSEVKRWNRSATVRSG